MDRLTSHLQQICSAAGRHWELDGDKLVIPVGDGGRHQTIRFSRDVDHYVITSVVIGQHRVTKSTKQWRDLAKLAWHRNAEHEVVSFAFDQHDRLVGQVRHPAAYLNPEELELYVTTLARECDRFEFLLSGADVF